MNKVISAQQAMQKVKNGDVVMIGGFLKGGSPDLLIKELTRLKVQDLTIVRTDTGTADSVLYELYTSGAVKKFISSYIGANPVTGEKMMSGEIEGELVPQGTLAERIRAGGAGLGGILTPTGIGTVVEKGKQKIELDGETYLLERALKANVSLVKANIADKAGNLVINGSARNFNVVMATAGEYVVAQADKVVETGELDPNCITVPGVFVHAVVPAGE